MKKAAVIGLILAMTLTLGACGGKDTSGAASPSKKSETTSDSQNSQENDEAAAGAASQNDSASESEVSAETGTQNAAAAGTNTTDVAGTDVTDAAGTNVTDAAGANMTSAAGDNMTSAAGSNMTGAAGGNTTAGSGPARPVILDPTSMKTAYQPETEEQKYAREITGIYLLTDLKDTQSDETGAKATQLQSEGLPMYMEFFSNGTMREVVFGDPMGGLWDRVYLTLGSDRIPYEFKGDHVTVTTDNMNLTFTRTTQEELDLLLAAGKDSADAGSGDAAESGDAAANGETAEAGNEAETDNTAANVDVEANSAAEGTGEAKTAVPKRREEIIISAGSSGAAGENGTDAAAGTAEEDLYGTVQDDAYAGTEGEDIYGEGGDIYGEGEVYGDVAGDAAGTGIDETAGAADMNGLEGTEADIYETAEPQIQDYIIQDDLCSMYVTGYDFSDPRGFVIKVTCENYSIYNMDFNITYSAINNVMFVPSTPEGGDHWSLEVEPLSNRESEIIFSADKALEYGITSYDYVMLSMWVRNADQWTEPPIYTGDEELYPTNKVTGEGIQNLTRLTTPGEQKIADENKFTFTILGSEVRENGDYVLKACIENKSWQNLTFTWDDVYVNEGLLDPFWAVETLPNTICYDDIVFTAKDLQEHGVSAISDVTFTMSIVDSKDWLSYAIYTKTSTYRA